MIVLSGKSTIATLNALRVEQGANDAYSDKQRAEGADNRRAGRQIAVERPVQSSDSADGGDDPSQNQTRANAANEINGTNRRHNQITEYQKDAGDADENCND